MNAEIMIHQLPQPLAPASWDSVRRWTGLAAQFGRCSIACQVMAGFELLALHEEQQVRGGRPKEKLGHGGRVSWRGLIEKELQIPGRTGDRWMHMAELFQAKYGKLNAPERLRALLEVSPRQWSNEDTNFMVNFLDEVTEGKSQAQFMIDLGLRKQPKALPAPKAPPTPADVSAAEAAGEWRDLRARIERYGIKFVALDDAAVQAQMNVAATMFQAREQWLRTVQAERAEMQRKVNGV